MVLLERLIVLSGTVYKLVFIMVDMVETDSGRLEVQLFPRVDDERTLVQITQLVIIYLFFLFAAYYQVIRKLHRVLFPLLILLLLIIHIVIHIMITIVILIILVILVILIVLTLGLLSSLGLPILIEGTLRKDIIKRNSLSIFA